MKQVSLDSVYLHNFKSFHQPTTITPSSSTGLKFLSGRNLVEPRLGSNGSGKSTIWDAVCWCLYGVGVRGQKASELVSYGEDRSHVVLRLQIDDRVHTIERFGSPNRLIVNRAAVGQEEVDKLVGLNRLRFLQSVLFGQGADLFLDMAPAGRGELLDGVLDLGLWVEAAEAAGRQATVLSQSIADLAQSLSFERGRLAGAEDEVMLQRLSDRWQTEHDRDLEDHIRQVAEAEKLIAELYAEIHEIDELQDRLPDFGLMDLTIQKHESALQQVTEIDGSLEFYRTLKICPTCRQSVSTETAHGHVSTLLERKGRADAVELEQELKLLRAEKLDAVQRKHELGSRLMQRDYEVVHHNKYLAMLVDRTEKLGASPNPYTERLAELKTIKAETEARVAELETEQITAKGKFSLIEYWKTGFKKVRLYQTKQVLLRMEVETANAASALGIGSWQIRYVTETETKSGTMRPGIQVLVNDGPWEGFSGGEAQRVRLAVTLGIASMIQGMAGVNYNFEVFDEPSQYLSVEGVEDLLTCLQNRAETYNKSIWICDHSALSFGGFQETWTVTKTQEGSRLGISTQSN